MKKIDTLVTDIYDVIDGKGGWHADVSARFARNMNSTMVQRLSVDEPTKGKGTIRMSNVGQPCARKLWFHVNTNNIGQPLPPAVKMKFLYGDIIEETLLSLAQAAGHKVTGQQDELYVGPIKGHRDAVIDGMLVDVKSASTFSYRKFKENAIRSEDPFGYLPQLTGYLYASQSDPLVTEKNKAAFLVMDKQHGHICLDVYDLSKEMENMDELVQRRIEQMAQDKAPPRHYKDKPQSKTSPNRMLDVACSYCDHKYNCWPGLKGYAYSGRPPVFLTEVKKKPNVPEIKP